MMKSLFKLMTLCLLLFASGMQTAVAADAVFGDETKIVASDGKRQERFGSSVAIDGTRMAVSASRADIGGNDWQGAVYLYEFDGSQWQETAKLTADDGAKEDYFGYSLALDGDRLVVGANSADIGGNENQGAAYVFDLKGGSWQQTAKLTADDGAKDDGFGYSLALDGDRLVVGASVADIGGNANQGAAYVFDFNGSSWQQRQKLTAADGAKDDWFGDSLALDGERIVVGILNSYESSRKKGVAYVFDLKGGSWQQSQNSRLPMGRRGIFLAARLP